VRTGWLALLGPVIAAVLVAGAASAGLLGGRGDFQSVQDIRRALGSNDLSPAAPFSYPLVRDTVVWLLAAIMVAQVMIMHRQWQLFATGLAKLNANGVLHPVARPVTGGDRSDGSGTPGLREPLAAFAPERRLAEYVRRVNRLDARRAGVYTAVFTAVAVIFALLLMWAEQNRLFRVLTPDGVSKAEAEAWRRSAYQHWWAGTSHPGGAVAYYGLVAVAIYVVIVQTHVGVRVTQLATRLPRLVLVDANWTNPDGEYGWWPLRQVFRTVWISMALYGLLVSALAVVLGLGTAGWVPAGIWLVLSTTYFATPWLGLRKIEQTARARRIAAAQAEPAGLSLRDQDELAERIRRYREARIRPMRLTRLQVVPVVASVLLPLVLNVLSPILESVIRS
jgi:hypothetical protein